MQVIYLINKLGAGVAAALRQWHSEHLSAALTRELNLTDSLMRADIQMLIEHATPRATPAADLNSEKGSTPTSDATHMRGGFRTMPLPGLPTHTRYSSS